MADSATQAGAAAPPIRHDHDVQFYEDETCLYDSVSRHIAPGLRAGHPVIVIATPTHIEAFRTRIASDGLDVGGATRQGLLTLLDAHETLATFMAGKLPDPERFRTSVGNLIESTRSGREHLPLRAFGEMVDVLWREGNPVGAIELEILWNQLAATHSFSLVCAYAMTNFANEGDASHFKQVCTHHRRVIPTERYSNIGDSDSQLREISILQQKARALETEIEQRKQLEGVLREALTARQEAEAQIRQSEQELKDFFENATEGLHWVSEDGVILWANQSELDLVGYTRDEYIGQHIADFHVDVDKVSDLMTRLQRNETLHNFESRLRHKDGTFRSVLISSNSLWRNGEFVHTRCFTRDITDRKNAQEARDRLLVWEQKARQEAEKANRLKDQFLATISHELLTPLSAILGWIPLAKKDAVKPLVVRALDVIERNATIQLQLVEDLLNISRMLAGKLAMNRVALDLGATVRNAAESIRPKAKEKNIELHVSIDSAVGQMQGDVNRLLQVVGNLLTNAVKFTPENGRIDLIVERDANNARLTVRDNGIGISADFLPHVFDRFRQFEDSLIREHDGLGLGLAIVRYLVEAHHGTVRAYSEGVGKGSTFIVELPLN